MHAMTRRERLMATLRGQPVDRPAVSFYEITGFDERPADPDPFNTYMRDNGPHTAESFLLRVELGRRGVRSFDRVPVRIAAPPQERPVPAAGREARRLRAYFAGLDAKLADDVVVRRNWREISVRHLGLYLRRIAAGDYPPERYLDETLGRLLFVAENRAWVREAACDLAERWNRQRALRDPLHRPYYRIERKWQEPQKPLAT